MIEEKNAAARNTNSPAPVSRYVQIAHVAATTLINCMNRANRTHGRQPKDKNMKRIAGVLLKQAMT